MRRSKATEKLSDLYDPNSDEELDGSGVLPTLANHKKLAAPRRARAGARDHSLRESANFRTVQQPSPPRRAPYPIPAGVQLSPTLAKKANAYLQNLSKSDLNQSSSSPAKDARTSTLHQ